MKILVVGGGAAGFFGAIACAQAYPHHDITIIEAGAQVLTKVKISGGGRCNVTHACFDPAQLVQHYPRGSRALRGAFSRFQPQDTVAWFKRQGVQLKTEPDGRMFPVTDESQTILDCLIQTAETFGIKIWTQAPVTQIKVGDSARRVSGFLFQVQFKSGTSMGCDRLLMASGSHPLGYRIAKSLGHQLVAPVPSLFTFRISDSRLQNLAGVSVQQTQVTLKVGAKYSRSEWGPTLITHWGVSGPAILKLSAWAARELFESRYRAKLILNWLPQATEESVRLKLLSCKQDWCKRGIYKINPVDLPLRLWQSLVSAAEIVEDKRWADLSSKELNRLIQELIHGEYEVTGKGQFKDEFVTCGGIPLKEVNFKTLESRVQPGLYFAGEILDVDGVTGGFNFQNAWTTGWLAGQAMGLE